jgi:hypothetical protein
MCTISQAPQATLVYDYEKVRNVMTMLTPMRLHEPRTYKNLRPKYLEGNMYEIKGCRILIPQKSIMTQNLLPNKKYFFYQFVAVLLQTLSNF